MTNPELFETTTGLLAWLPGESLFSLASRQHALWGYANAGETAQILFGKKHSGVHHDFPSGLDELELRTDGAWGTAQDIGTKRTLLSFYRPFATTERMTDCLAMMRSHSVTHLKYRLGLLTSRFRANHPLKACPTCMASDDASTGWAYWHLVHQYPGVWFCPNHGDQLHEATIKATGVNRFLWALPEPHRLLSKWTESITCQAALQKLSEMTLQILQRTAEPGWLTGPFVVPVFREEVRRRGGLTLQGNLRTRVIASGFLEWCQRLRGPEELAALASTPKEAELQIGRLLTPWRTGTHPLRVLVMASWLFDDADSFVNAYQNLHGAKAAHSTPEEQSIVLNASANTEQDCRKRQILNLVKSGRSATAAAAEMGVTVGTAMAWLAQANIKVKRRSKSFKAEVRTALKKDLLKGESKAIAAAKHGVTVQSVTRFLLTEPGLHEKWQEVVFANTLQNARKTWLRDSTKYGHLGTKWIRAQNPSIYAWLYRNDRAWIQDNLPPPFVRSEARKSLDWDSRDVMLSTETAKVVVKLQASQSNRQLFLWQIYQALPQLKPKLRSLEKLPLTRQVIERALCRSHMQTPLDLV